MEVGKLMAWCDPDNKTSCLVTIKEINEDTILCANEHTELQAYPEDLKHLEDVMCCNNCGSLDIQEKAWVYSNTLQYADAVDSVSCWCDVCTSENRIVSVNEYLKNKNNG
jgi:hypothetical protein